MYPGCRRVPAGCMTPLEIIARAHALGCAVAQMPSAPPPGSITLSLWDAARAERDALPVVERARAQAAFDAMHRCRALTCPWGLRGEPPADFIDRGAELIAYCDGSGTQAHLPCGAGVVVYDGADVVLEASRSLGLGTNNHAEVSAVRIALAITDTPAWRARPLVVRTDSMYAIGALTAPAAPPLGRPNARLISVTRGLMVGRTVRFEHVRGHSGEPGNERADELAGLARLRGVALQGAA